MRQENNLICLHTYNMLYAGAACFTPLMVIQAAENS